jgi:hypothetical protein
MSVLSRFVPFLVLSGVLFAAGLAPAAAADQNKPAKVKAVKATKTTKTGGIPPAKAADDKPTKATDEKPTKLGVTKNWTAFTRNTSAGKVCYALSKPVESAPANAKRNDVYVLINDWPTRKVKGEVQISTGYAFKDNATVTVTVADVHIDFFTKNEGDNGYAWIKNADDEQKLLDAMRRGYRMVVEGASKRGTKTKDTYSLDGISSALDLVHKECGK